MIARNTAPNKVEFTQLSMDQQSQAYVEYRQDSGDTISFSQFIEMVADWICWDKETGKPWRLEHYWRETADQ